MYPTSPAWELAPRRKRAVRKDSSGDSSSNRQKHEIGHSLAPNPSSALRELRFSHRSPLRQEGKEAFKQALKGHIPPSS